VAASVLYIALSLVVLWIIALAAIVTRKSKKPKQPSKCAMVAILLVISGIVFGEYRLLGYSLIGAGVLLALLDILKNLERRS
jgi:hypothetical protein